MAKNLFKDLLGKSASYNALLARKGEKEADNVIELLQRAYQQATTALGLVEPVKKEASPALRALIKKQFPELNKKPHLRAKIESEAQRFAGSLINPTIESAKGVSDYANAVNYLSQNANLKDLLGVVKETVELQQEPEGAQGFKSFPSSEGNVGQNLGSTEGYAGKVTLASRFVQPGMQALDTTLAKKVESKVQGDFFNYVAPNQENGFYNAIYLNDMQYEQEVRYKEPLDLPLPGDDQTNYFQSWELNPKYHNQQPVMMELEDKFEEELYGIYAAHDNNIDFLRDQQIKREPIEQEWQKNYLVPELTLMADNPDQTQKTEIGTWQPYRDPDQPRSAAYMNFVGERPLADSWRNPNVPSRFEPSTLTWPPQQIYDMVETNGAQAFSLA